VYSVMRIEDEEKPAYLLGYAYGSTTRRGASSSPACTLRPACFALSTLHENVDAFIERTLKLRNTPSTEHSLLRTQSETKFLVDACCIIRAKLLHALLILHM
jgi:hypothetical protein